MLRLVMAAVLVPSIAVSEPIITYKEPTETDIKKQQTQIRSLLNDAETYYGSTAYSEKLSEERAKFKQIPNVFPSNTLNVPDEVLNQKWATEFNNLEKKGAEVTTTINSTSMGPLVFASLSIPKENLKNVAAEAVRAGGGVLFRGLKNDDFRAMRAELSSLGEGFAIDPTLFERFSVTEVPCFVLPLEPVTPCSPEGCKPIKFVKVSGNLTLAAALEYISINSQDGTARVLAETYIKRLVEK